MAPDLCTFDIPLAILVLSVVCLEFQYAKDFWVVRCIGSSIQVWSFFFKAALFPVPVACMFTCMIWNLATRAWTYQFWDAGEPVWVSSFCDQVTGFLAP